MSDFSKAGRPSLEVSFWSFLKFVRVFKLCSCCLQDAFACFHFVTSSREREFCALLSAIKETEGQEGLAQLKAFADFQRRCEGTREHTSSFTGYHGEFEEYCEKVYTMWGEERAKKIDIEKQENEIEAKLREVADLIKAKDMEYVSSPLSKGDREKRKRVRWCAGIDEVARMAKKLKDDF